MHLVNRPDLPRRAGETPIIGIAPAVANAVFHATGVRDPNDAAWKQGIDQNMSSAFGVRQFIAAFNLPQSGFFVRHNSLSIFDRRGKR